MKRVTVVTRDEVEVRPFYPEEFSQENKIDIGMKKVSKKELKQLAQSLGMKYTDEEIGFAKKLITAYHNTYSEKR